MVHTVTPKKHANNSSVTFAPGSRNELPIIFSQNEYLVDAKLLHRKLGVKTRFNDWFERQVKSYSFQKEKDFYSNLSNQKFKGRGGDRRSNDFFLTIDMAKELCMVERSEIGRKFRRYFIEAEKELRTKRLYAQQATVTEISKKIRPMMLNGRKMFDYRKCQELLGFNTKTSTANIRNSGYAGLMVIFNRKSFVAEEYLKVMMASAKTRAIRQEAKNAKPVLPANFGQTSLFEGHKGGFYAAR